MAAAMSAAESTVPCLIVRLGWGVSFVGSRVMAVTLWPRARSSARMTWPDFPVAPYRAMFIVGLPWCLAWPNGSGQYVVAISNSAQNTGSGGGGGLMRMVSPGSEGDFP